MFIHQYHEYIYYIYIYIYMICKHILQITFWNKPRLFFFLHTVKWFQVLLYNSQNLTSVICLYTVCSIWLKDRTKAGVTTLFGWVFGFNGISTFVGYLMPNPFLYIYNQFYFNQFNLTWLHSFYSVYLNSSNSADSV